MPIKSVCDQYRKTSKVYNRNRTEINKANARINRKTRLGLHPTMQLKRLQPISQI